jgi:phage terminase small subunit
MARKPKQGQLEDDWRLTPLQARFVELYLADPERNGTKAALAAGCPAKSAHVTASRMLKLDKVQRFLAEAQAKAAERAELSAARVLEEYRRLAFVDVRGFYDEAGRLKSMSELTAEQGAALAGVETMRRNVEAGDGVTDTVYKIKLWDKIRALESLAKHFGLLVDKLEVSGEILTVEKRLIEARKRAAERGKS